MKKVITSAFLLFLIVLYHCSTAQNLPDANFIILDELVSDTSSDIADPEFDFLNHRFCWTNKEGIWLGYLDSVTGNFIPKNGKAILIDPTPSFSGMRAARNGPEWIDIYGERALVYPDSGDNGQSCTAISRFNGKEWVIKRISSLSPAIPVFAQASTNGQCCGLSWILYNQNTYEFDSMIVSPDFGKHQLGLPSLLGGRWAPGRCAVCFVMVKDTSFEVGYYDFDMGGYVHVANIQHPVDEVWLEPVGPDGKYILWVVERKKYGDQLQFFIEDSHGWKHYQEISMPSDRHYILSPETFTWKGKSYIFFIARAGDMQPYNLYDQLWVLGIGKDNPFKQMISSSLRIKRKEPEVYFTSKGPVIYYTEIRKDKRKVIHRCATGL